MADYQNIVIRRFVDRNQLIETQVLGTDLNALQVHRPTQKWVHYHPLADDFIMKLATPGKGVPGLLATVTQQDPEANFEQHSAYGPYNWELFYHVPMMIANQLSQNQRYEEAQKWYHYVFDPTRGSRDEVDPKPFWRFHYFKKTEVETLQGLVESLSDDALRDWLEHPFLPHYVARHRPQAYMMYALMKYLDNLIAWADHLFTRDTIESINEAVQLYLLAAQVLGPKPQFVPRPYDRPDQTYNTLRDGDRDNIFNPDVEAPMVFPFAYQTVGAGVEAQAALGMINTPYFCIPPNQKVLDYWDTISDRMFKIRHCRNIQGVERTLALFDPPIDPGLLVRASAMGLSIDSVLNDLYAPSSHYRYQVLLQKAMEFTNHVISLGNALLAALEKKDAEELTLLRSKQERAMLKEVGVIRQKQIEEANANIESLNKSRELAEKRKHFFSNREFMNNFEKCFLDKTKEAEWFHKVAALNEVFASIFHAGPSFSIPMGAGIPSISQGFPNIGSAFQAQARFFTWLASQLSHQGNLSNTMAGYHRRKDDWDLQLDLAVKEIEQIEKQLLAAAIRKAIAEKELQNHEKQVEQADELWEYYQSKFTNQQLYNWMVGQLSGLHYQTYKLALDMARKAEKAAVRELGLENPLDFSYVQSNHWAGLRKGLLAGEKLLLQLRMLDAGFMEKNVRELEITKHISLNELNPFAQFLLRENGTCDFAIPEELFDLDFPGHYMRRIKSVSITIPCVAGPYTSINATLRLKKSSTRMKASAGNGYPRSADGDDDRFHDQLTGIQSIATSSAQNDSGLFELNFRDERYLPFEYSGTISDWTLEMMTEPSLRQFDYNTIADVMIHLRYTAREDGALKTQAVAHLQAITNQLGEVPLARLFSLRHDFPNEWHAWSRQRENLSINLEAHHFPYWTQMGGITITEYSLWDKGVQNSPSKVNQTIDSANQVATLNILKAELSDPNDPWILVSYSVAKVD